METLKSQRNRVSKEIGALMGQKKIAEAEAKKAETKDLGDKIAALDKQAARAEATLEELMLRLPNLPHESVPPGKTAEDNPEIRVHGAKAEFTFKPKSHVDLCESLKLVDFARAAKLSGSGFLLYTNWGARLERALIQFLLDLHVTRARLHGSLAAVHGRRAVPGRASDSFQNSKISITAWRKATMRRIWANCI